MKLRVYFLSLHWINAVSDWINIIVYNSQYTNICSAEYAVTRHTVYDTPSVIPQELLTVHRSVHMVGTDKLLIIDSEINQPQNVFCDININSIIDLSNFSRIVEKIGRYSSIKVCCEAGGSSV